MADEITAEEPVARLIEAALLRGTDRLQRSLAMVEKGEDDAIHQVRVSCRRLRSDLRLFRKYLAGDWSGELRGELAALASACGEARDLEVISALVRANTTSEDDPDHVTTILATLNLGLDRATARAAVVIASERTTSLVEELEAVAAAPELKPKAARPCDEVLPDLLAAARGTFTLAADRLEPWTVDDDWHEVRLLAKRVRYAAETAATVLKDDTKDVAREAARYQELLGQHQDHCAVAESLTSLALDAEGQGDPELSFTLGRLVERHRAARRPLREEFLSLYHRP